MMRRMMYSFVVAVAMGLVACGSDKKNDATSTPSTNADPRDKYVGSWQCNETSKSTGSQTYTIGIAKSVTSSSTIRISYFYGLQDTVNATVNGNTMTIPYQQIGTVGFAQGSGTLSTSTQLNMTYTTTVGSTKDTCTAACTKL